MIYHYLILKPDFTMANLSTAQESSQTKTTQKTNVAKCSNSSGTQMLKRVLSTSNKSVTAPRQTVLVTPRQKQSMSTLEPTGKTKVVPVSTFSKQCVILKCLIYSRKITYAIRLQVS